jgi:hypothetical protein
MNDEFEMLNDEQKAAVEDAIKLTRTHNSRKTISIADDSEAYAYPHAQGTAWGVNGGAHGFNIVRGVWIAQ